MASALYYNGYAAKVIFNAESDCLEGTVVGIDEQIQFSADNVSDLKAAFIDGVEDYLSRCEKQGKPARKPYSGKLMLRIDPEIHAEVAAAAHLSGVSINKWAQEALGRVAKYRLGQASSQD